MSRSLQTLGAATAILIIGCTPSFNAMDSPDQPNPWVIRTDFSDDDRWSSVRDRIAAPQTLFGMKVYANVDYVNDESQRDREPHEVVVSLPDDYPDMFCFVVDRECIVNEDYSVLVVGFYPSDNESFDRLPRDTPIGDITTFRALPSQIPAIENNLSIANMGFEDFANSVDDDGVFRGFPH